MSATPGTRVTSANSNVTTNTSLVVTLATTTVGQLNFVEISGFANGAAVNPTMTTPTGWTKVTERMDTAGTPASWVGLYWRVYTSGDSGGSVTTQTFSWTGAQGQMIAICTPWTLLDTTTPVSWSLTDFKVTSDVNYAIPFSGTTTTTAAGTLCWGFANRTGTAWTNLTDSDKGQVGLAASSTMVSRYISGSTASGTTFNKTATGSNTSVGVSWAYVINDAVAATFTNGTATTFTYNSAGTFTITTVAGTPTPTITTASTLPTGVTLTDNGNGTATLAGTPTQSGSFPLTIAATNSAGTTNQSFSLTVNRVSTFSSGTSTTFTNGSAGTFTVTTANGYPTPVLTLFSGTLPSGVTFTDNGDGTATLAGTPTQNGVFSPVFKSTNTAGTPTQSFTLTVNQAPAFTSGSSYAFTNGSAGSFTVTTTGSPTPVLTRSGTLPTGVTFTDNGNGTATIAGTTTATGSYPLTLTATNSVSAPTQSFTITVSAGAAPTTTSTASLTGSMRAAPMKRGIKV